MALECQENVTIVSHDINSVSSQETEQIKHNGINSISSLPQELKNYINFFWRLSCSRKGKFCVNIGVIFVSHLFLCVAYIVQRATLYLSCSHALGDVSSLNGKFWNVLCPGSRAYPRPQSRTQATLTLTRVLTSGGRTACAPQHFLVLFLSISCGSIFYFYFFECNSYHKQVRLLLLTLNLICTGEIIY